MKASRHILPLLIAAAGIALAQIHGGPTWVALFGSPELGWTASITWEAASVWLWWRADRTWAHRTAKWAATLALMGGMVAPSIAPLLSGAARTETARAVLDVLRGQAAAGHWVSQRALIRAAAASEGAPPWALQASALAAALAIPALYALALLALTTVSREARANESARGIRGFHTRPETGATGPKTAPKPDPAPSPETSQKPALERGFLVSEYARKHGLTTKGQVAEKLVEHSSTFSEFLKGKTGPEVSSRIVKKLNLDKFGQ